MAERPVSRSAALDVRSLPEQIADLLRERIMSGQLRPGDQVVESRLAKQLGVGQNAVREALQDLEFQGFVVKFPNRGTFVTKLSREDLDQIYRIRAELEALAVEWARKHNRPDARDVERLEAMLQESEKGAAAGDFYTFARADTEFHRCLWEMSGNAYLQKALEVVAVPLLSYVLIESQEHTALNLKRLVQQHRDWLRVIASSSAEEAAEYTRKSIQSFWEQVVEVIGDRPSQNA